MFDKLFCVAYKKAQQLVTLRSAESLDANNLLSICQRDPFHNVTHYSKGWCHFIAVVMRVPLAVVEDQVWRKCVGVFVFLFTHVFDAVL